MLTISDKDPIAIDISHCIISRPPIIIKTTWSSLFTFLIVTTKNDSPVRDNHSLYEKNKNNYNLKIMAGLNILNYIILLENTLNSSCNFLAFKKLNSYIMTNTLKTNVKWRLGPISNYKLFPKSSPLDDTINGLPDLISSIIKLYNFEMHLNISLNNHINGLHQNHQYMNSLLASKVRYSHLNYLDLFQGSIFHLKSF